MWYHYLDKDINQVKKVCEARTQASGSSIHSASQCTPHKHHFEPEVCAVELLELEFKSNYH